jgi:hypothetical protein
MSRLDGRWLVRGMVGEPLELGVRTCGGDFASVMSMSRAWESDSQTLEEDMAVAAAEGVCGN